MSFKKVRYNLLVIGLIALVGCYLGLSFFISHPNNSNSNAGGDNNITIPVEPGDDEEDENFYDNDDNFTNGSAEDSQIPEDEVLLVKYGIDNLNNSKSYNSTFFSTIVNKAAGIGATQYVEGRVDKGENSKGEKVFVEENYYHSDETGAAGSMVANYFRGLYSNVQTGETQVAITNKYNYSEKTYNLEGASRNEVVSTKSAVNEFKLLQGDVFPIQIDKSTVEYRGKYNSEYGKAYKQILIKVKLNNPKALSQGYIDYFASSGQLTNVQYSEINLYVDINTRTGEIKKITKKEILTATAVGVPMLGSVGVTSSVTTIQIFSNYNTDIILKDSL